MTNQFILDANTFIQAKNREYRFEFAQAFWNWIEDAHKAGVVFSTLKVRSEINGGRTSCPLRKWASHLPKGFWLADANSGAVIGRYKQVIQWAYSQPQFTPKALTDFADSKNADAFLIATALSTGMHLVTHESASTDSRSRVLVPHAAHALGVTTVGLYDLLSIHATATFTFKP